MKGRGFALSLFQDRIPTFDYRPGNNPYSRKRFIFRNKVKLGNNLKFLPQNKVNSRL